MSDRFCRLGGNAMFLQEVSVYSDAYSRTNLTVVSIQNMINHTTPYSEPDTSDANLSS